MIWGAIGATAVSIFEIGPEATRLALMFAAAAAAGLAWVAAPAALKLRLGVNEIISTLNQQGNTLSFKQVPREVFAGWFPHADGIAAMLAYFEAHTYLGTDSRDAIALANKVSGQQPTPFAAWAQTRFAIPAAA